MPCNKYHIMYKYIYIYTVHKYLYLSTYPIELKIFVYIGFTYHDVHAMYAIN